MCRDNIRLCENSTIKNHKAYRSFGENTVLGIFICSLVTQGKKPFTATAFKASELSHQLFRALFFWYKLLSENRTIAHLCSVLMQILPVVNVCMQRHLSLSVANKAPVRDALRVRCLAAQCLCAPTIPRKLFA